MNIRSENRVVKEYEARKICECGAKANHISGLCWRCFDHHPASYTKRVLFKMWRDEHKRLGIERKEGENQAEHNARCRQWCIEHSTLLREYAKAFTKRREDIEEAAVMAGIIPD